MKLKAEGCKSRPSFIQEIIVPFSSREKRNEYTREWKSRRRKSFFDNKECCVCGSTENLELHHRDPSKKISHRIWSWGDERRLAEIDKCDILCKSCHGNHHHRELRGKERVPLVHGTAQGYWHKKCRCNLCTSAVIEYNRNRKIRLAERSEIKVGS